MSDLIKNRPLTDHNIGLYFGFDTDDIKNINNLHKKSYNFEYTW